MAQVERENTEGRVREKLRAGVAVGETVILLHPPSSFSRCFNRNVEGTSAK